MQREETLLQKLYFIRSMIDIVLQSVPVEKRGALLNAAIIQKLNDNYVDLATALVNYEDIMDDISDAEEQENIRTENDKQAQVDFGESFTRLVKEVNSKMKTKTESIGVYIGRKTDGHTFLQVIDEINQKILRTYDDTYDLQINIEQDLKTKFKCQKIEIGKNIKPLNLKKKK